METELQKATKVKEADIEFNSPKKSDTGKKLNDDINIFSMDSANKSSEKLSESEEALLKDSQPMWLTDQYIIRPCVSILLGFLLLIIFTFIAVKLDYFALNPASQREYLIWDDPRAKAWDKKLVAEEYILTSAGSEGSQKPLRMTSVPQWNPMILYESKNGKSLLEKSNLVIIYNIEKNIKALEDWPNICKAKSISEGACGPDAYISPLTFLLLDG